MPTGSEYIGVVAQEVESVAPYMIHTFTHTDSTGSKEEYLDFDATALPYIIINAIKDQQNIIEEKDAQLQLMMDELRAIKKELEEIKKGVSGKHISSKSASQALTEEVLPGRSARLWQNIPNPFGEHTSIRYQIPGEFRQAYISISSLAGQSIKRIAVTQSQGEVNFEAGILANGIYIYQLWVDGQLTDSKKLIVAK